MVSVTSASRYITSASRYHSRYKSRSSMYILVLIPRNFAELAEAVPIDHTPNNKWESDKKHTKIITCEGDPRNNTNTVMYNFLMNADPALKFFQLLLVSIYMCIGHV